MAKLEGLGVLWTSMCRVLPSVSMNTGRGKWEAKVVFPIPSGP